MGLSAAAPTGASMSEVGGSRSSGADVKIVADDPDVTEHELAAGELACPDCEGELRPWGHARRRWLRTRHGRRQLRPRRACCQACRSTHVLLPGVALPRRADAVEVIAEALTANAAGVGHRPIAARLGRPEATVRGWLRRFAARADQTITHAVACIYRYDPHVSRVQPDPELTPVQSALATLAQAAEACQRSVNKLARSRWQVVSALCSGRLLANTSCPYPQLR